MRNVVSAATALFPGTRGLVLGAAFGDPARWWYLSEMARTLGTSPSSLQRVLESLFSSGILETRRDGRRVYYRPNPKSALFHELRAIVRKTMGVPTEIQRALEPIRGRIDLAAIFGSTARGTDRANSDVDLLVVGRNLTLEELYRRLAPAERRLGRNVNPTLYTPEEFSRRRAAQNPFLEKVLSRDRIVLIGSEDDVSTAR